MKLDFILNDYLLMWHLLYESSVSEEIHNIKQVLWKDYKKEYSALYKEKDKILNDLDNYIPDDDFIFNIFETSPSYKKVIKETNKYRMSLLQLWDLNGKLYKKELANILKYDLENLVNRFEDSKKIHSFNMFKVGYIYVKGNKRFYINIDNREQDLIFDNIKKAYQNRKIVSYDNTPYTFSANLAYANSNMIGFVIVLIIIVIIVVTILTIGG